MTYLLQVSTCWILLYGIYLVFLQKETFFNVNRYYLLGALLAGLVIPYLGALLPANEASVEIYQVMTQINAVEVTPAYVIQEESIYTWYNALWAIYIVGGLVVFSRFTYGLYRIFSIYNGAEKTTQEKYILVESDKYHLPFSFFNYIFISKKLPLNADVEKVLMHEELHANQWHSLDIVFTELLQVFFWFNPILIMYKGALRQSHEYLADAYVTEDHNRSSYGQLLLRQSTSGLEIALANQFFHSQIKKRITMMYKEKSKRSAMVKYLAAVPVLAAMLIIFSSSKMNQDYSKELLRTEFEELYVEVTHQEMSFIETNLKWDRLLNKYATHANIDQVSADIKEVASDFGINLEVDLKEDGQSYQFSLLYHMVPPDNVEEWREDTEIESPYNLRFNPDPENNFGGRKIIQRNWMSFYGKYKGIKGKITMSAEANMEGDIINAEILKDKTTVTDKVVLKDALKATKGFKIQAGKENVTGELILNLGFRNPKQQYYFDETDEKFKKDGNFNIGNRVPKGSVSVRSSDHLLVENEDYKIDYEKGKLTIVNEAYLDGAPINVSFEDQGDPIFKVVEEMPRFPGCEDMEGTREERRKCAQEKMLNFIYSNLNYPADAKNQGIEGMVVIQFVVEKNGTIADVKKARDIGAGCGVESQRVVNSMPNWIPGKQRGKAVRVQYMLPVKFKLEGPAKTKEEEVAKIVAMGEASKKAKKEKLVINKGNDVKDPEIFKVVQEMPRFPGCEDMEGTTKEKEQCARDKMLEYIYTNIKYPKEARQEGIDGMAVVQMIIEKDGSVNLVNTVRDPGAGTGSEASRVVREMPNWIPGMQGGKAVRVQYTLPVKFKLEDDTKGKNIKKMLEGKIAGVKIKDIGDQNIRLNSPNAKGLDPLIVIDGKIKPKAKIESINPDDILTINVRKGDKANDLYGDKGVNGVLEINLKPKEERTSYLIDGQMFDYGFYKSIDKSHIKEEKPASREAKFMRGVSGEMIEVNMLAGYGYNSAYFPGTNTEEGSTQALLTFVGNNIKYPKNAIDNNIEGLVTVHYKVDVDGTITNFEIGRSAGWGLDEAVLSMMEKMKEEKGLWKSAYLDRRPIASSLVLPVKFKLQDDQKKEAKNRRLNIEMLDISPNPTNGIFNISFELEDKSPVDILFYTINGQLIKSITGVSNNYKNTIDLTGNGGQTILVNIIQNGKVHTNKVVIQ